MTTDTTPLAPTDAEIEALWNDSRHNRFEVLSFARAVLAKWAAPQQEAQEPCGWTTGITWRPDTRLQSEQVIKITRDTQPKYGYTTPIYTAPQPAPLSDDTKRLDWLLWKLPGDALRYVVGELSDTSSGAEFRAAIDAAIAAQGGK